MVAPVNRSNARRLVHVASFVLLALAALQWLLRAGLIATAVIKRGPTGFLSEMMDATIRMTGNPGVSSGTIVLVQGALILATVLVAIIFFKTR